MKGLELITTSSGHPAIPILPAKPVDEAKRLVIQDKGLSSARQYMAFAVSTASLSPSRPLKVPATPTTATSPSKPLKVPSTSTTSLSRPLKVPTTFTTSPDNDDANHGSYNKGPQYRIFYDKKLSPQAKELLCQDRLHEQSSVAWWEGTKHSSDFWLKGESAWFRIHVTPRKALCNPILLHGRPTLQYKGTCS